MTLDDLIPGRRVKQPKKHRADDRIAELREENITLLNRQAAADDFFAILMNDVVVTNQALCQVEALRQDAEQAAAQMRMERDEWMDEALALRARIAPFLAAEANANRVDVPPMQRDTSDPADQATGPIPVITLQQAFGTTDPAHVPAWAIRD